jgi:hypothetical protein
MNLSRFCCRSGARPPHPSVTHCLNTLAPGWKLRESSLLLLQGFSFRADNGWFQGSRLPRGLPPPGTRSDRCMIGSTGLEAAADGEVAAAPTPQPSETASR